MGSFKHGHSHRVDGISFSPDGKRILTASADVRAVISPLLFSSD
jgi:WD40 repeat protein